MGKVLVVNKGFSDNLGDQAICVSLVNYFENMGYVVNFQDLTFSRKDDTIISKSKVNVSKLSIIKSIVHKIGLYQIIWSLKNFHKVFLQADVKYDFVVIGGGQLVLSNTLFPIATFLWCLCLKLKKRDYYFLSVGVGEHFSFFEKKLFKFSLINAQKVLVRDSKSLLLCKTIFNLENCIYSPDAALLFPIERYIFGSQKKVQRTLVGIVDYRVYKKYNSNGVSIEQYYDLWYKNYITNECKDVYLFYTTSNDLKESLNFQEYVELKYNRKLEILEIRTLTDLVRELDIASKVVSGRMHGLLLGAKNNCEIVPFIISHKIKMFSEEYASETIDLHLLREELVKSIRKEIIQDEGSYR